MGIIIDTCLLIASERRRFDFPAFCAAHPGEAMWVSSITVSELRHGWERASDPMIRGKRKQFVEDALAQLGVIPFGTREAEHHARIWAALEAQGLKIGPHDFIVAATALSVGFPVATLNRRVFQRVAGLDLVSTEGFEFPIPQGWPS